MLAVCSLAMSTHTNSNIYRVHTMDKKASLEFFSCCDNKVQRLSSFATMTLPVKNSKLWKTLVVPKMWTVCFDIYLEKSFITGTMITNVNITYTTIAYIFLKFTKLVTTYENVIPNDGYSLSFFIFLICIKLLYYDAINFLNFDCYI